MSESRLRRFSPFHTATILVAAAAMAAPALAGDPDIEQYYFENEWLDAIDPMGGAYTTLDFTGFEDGEILTDQYVDEGVFFPGVASAVTSSSSFLNDGWGMYNRGERMIMEFSESQNWIAADYPGTLVISLYQGDELLGDFLFPTSGQGFFAGLVSETAFDRAELWEAGTAFVDDIRFGATIPAPGVLATMFLGALAPCRRRRS